MYRGYILKFLAGCMGKTIRHIGLENGENTVKLLFKFIFFFFSLVLRVAHFSFKFLKTELIDLNHFNTNKCKVARLVCLMQLLTVARWHDGSKASKTMHWGKEITHSLAPLAPQCSIPLRSILLHCAPLHSAPLRVAPLRGSFMSEKVAYIARLAAS